MFNFVLKGRKWIPASKSLNKHFLSILCVLKEEDVKKPIHLNLLDTYCFKIPHVFKKDDIVVVTKEPTFNIDEYKKGYKSEFEEIKDVGEIKMVTHVYSIGIAVCLEGDVRSRSIDRIRPATKEEIEIFKKERNKKEQVLDFYQILASCC